LINAIIICYVEKIWQFGQILSSTSVNPVRNSSGALNPALRGGTPYGAEPGIILKSNPAAEPCTAWCTGQSSGALFLTG